MKQNLLATLVLSGLCLSASAQKVKFTEYDLNNGLHVILHQDKTAPVVAVSVMYHVGSKDEDPQRTGFAHFFEHLLFEGSDNMKRGEFMKTVSSNGGQTMPTPVTTALFTMRCSLPTSLNLAYGWKVSVCCTQRLTKLV